jgi:hypothetical protein
MGFTEEQVRCAYLCCPLRQREQAEALLQVLLEADGEWFVLYHYECKASEWSLSKATTSMTTVTARVRTKKTSRR